MHIFGQRCVFKGFAILLMYHVHESVYDHLILIVSIWKVEKCYELFHLWLDLQYIKKKNTRGFIMDKLWQRLAIDSLSDHYFLLKSTFHRKQCFAAWVYNKLKDKSCVCLQSGKILWKLQLFGLMVNILNIG